MKQWRKYDTSSVYFRWAKNGGKNIYRYINLAVEHLSSSCNSWTVPATRREVIEPPTSLRLQVKKLVSLVNFLYQIYNLSTLNSFSNLICSKKCHLYWKKPLWARMRKVGYACTYAVHPVKEQTALYLVMQPVRLNFQVSLLCLRLESATAN